MWPYIKNPLLNAYKEALEVGELGISQKQGVISLIPKEGKDQDYRKKLEANHPVKSGLQDPGKMPSKKLCRLNPLATSAEYTCPNPKTKMFVVVNSESGQHRPNRICQW